MTMGEELDYITPEKGPPIVCLMCKTARRGEERLFMFGGTRPFMAKFETKFVAFIGREKFVALCDENKTKRDRSYICKHCYSVVDKTFDSIRKIQRGIARSVRKVEGQSQFSDDETNSDEDENAYCQPDSDSRKKLPPVAERIAKKVASLTLVKINSRIPQIVLTPLRMESQLNSRGTGDDNNDTSANVSVRNATDHHLISDDSSQHPLQGTSESVNEQAIEGELEHSLSIPTTEVSETSVTVSQTRLDTGDVSDSQNAEVLSSHQDQDLTDFDRDSTSYSKADIADLAEILANPLLMVKSPQPIKLPDVKNENIYLCGENGCDWVFSSKFFWENHIRHYHYYGKPHKCPFKGCNKYFPTKSKQRQHVRKHTGERPFVCEQCGKTFRGAQELRHHRGTHTVGKPYQCPKPGCYKFFKYINSLKRHLQFHDGNYPFPCSYPKCNKAFKNKYELKCHYRLHTGERPYKCHEPGCGKAFRLPCEFTKHRRAHTGERPFRCQWEGCSAAYITCGGLASHVLSHSNDQHFCCEICGKTFKHKMSYRSHLKQHTDPTEEFLCKVANCGLVFTSKRQLLSHMGNVHNQLGTSSQPTMKIKTSEDACLCPVRECGQRYTDKMSLDQHLAAVHDLHDHESELVDHINYVSGQEDTSHQFSTDGDFQSSKHKAHAAGTAEGKASFSPSTEKLESHPCPYSQCDKRFTSSSSLRDHVTKCHVSIPREKLCPLCGQAFPHIQQLELHTRGFHQEHSVLNEHTNGVFICKSEKCGLQFDTAEQLSSHVSWHQTDPPYRCQFAGCQRTFLLEKAYEQHMLDHNQLKPHRCQVEGCNEAFATQLKLLKHSKIHYGCFQCPVEGCGKKLQAINSARIHLVRHTGEKPYVCTLCGMSFAACAQRIRHERTHTGEKPYSCDECQAKFADAGMLKIHMRSHTGEKPYRCEKCDHQFVSQSARRSHMRQHTGELPFVCEEPGCGKAFRESSSLRSHQNVHGEATHLCSQCGKVYKFSLSKHKCRPELTSSSPTPQPAQPPPPPPLPHVVPPSLQPQPVPPSAPAIQQQLIPQALSEPPPPTLPKIDYIPPLQQPQQHVPVATIAQQPQASVLLPASQLQQQLPLPVNQAILPPPPVVQPSPQYNAGNLMMFTDQVPGPSTSFVTEVQEAADTDKETYGTGNGQDMVLMQEADRNLMISSPYYNYMILYDRPVTQ